MTAFPATIFDVKTFALSALLFLCANAPIPGRTADSPIPFSAKQDGMALRGGAEGHYTITESEVDVEIDQLLVRNASKVDQHIREVRLVLGYGSDGWNPEAESAPAKIKETLGPSEQGSLKQLRFKIPLAEVKREHLPESWLVVMVYGTEPDGSKYYVPYHSPDKLKTEGSAGGAIDPSELLGRWQTRQNDTQTMFLTLQQGNRFEVVLKSDLPEPDQQVKGEWHLKGRELRLTSPDLARDMVWTVLESGTGSLTTQTAGNSEAKPLKWKPVK